MYLAGSRDLGRLSLKAGAYDTGLVDKEKLTARLTRLSCKDSGSHAYPAI